MSERDALMRHIIEHPEDDAPRLVFADWLDEHGEPERAEFIRVQCELEPLRDDHESDRADVLRRREKELAAVLDPPARERHRRLFGERRYSVHFDVRRGFEEEVALPVQWLIDDGDRIRAEFPTVTRAVVFRLNGWGERLAACPHLAGLRELHVACWAGETDIRALFDSPYLTSLRKLLLFGTGQSDGMFVVPATLPTLREVEVWWGDAARCEATPGGPSVRCVDPLADRLYAFAPGGGGYFDANFPGRLPDGKQFMALMPEPGTAVLPYCLFDRDGVLLGEHTLALPVDLTVPPDLSRRKDWIAETRRLEAGILAHLRATLGHRPGLIRVRSTPRDYPVTYDMPSGIEDEIGRSDDPDMAPENDRENDERGYGYSVWDWFRGRRFCSGGDGGWWVNGVTGDVEST